MNYLTGSHFHIHSVRRGFSMVELLAAIAVIAFGLIPLLLMLSSSHQNTRLTAEEFIGTNIATEVIESIQSLPYEFLSEVEEARVIDFSILPEASKRSDVKIPPLPPGFRIFLSLTKLNLRDDLPDCKNLSSQCFPKAVKERTAVAAQPFLINVRVEWETGNPNAWVTMATVKGCY